MYKGLIGVAVGAPLAAIASLTGLLSAAVGSGGGKLAKKVTKHEKTVSLAEATHLSINRLVPKALNDAVISDTEFNLIVREVENYSLKTQLRSKARSNEKEIERQC